MNSSPYTIQTDMPMFITAAFNPGSGRSRSLPLNAVPGGRRASALAAIVLRKKSEVDIVLDGDDEFIHSYSTYDEIRGKMEMKFEKDTPFDDISIIFEGQSDTFVEKIATTAPTTARTTGKHTFLRMSQPISEELLPADFVAKANVTYTLPFTFTVPERLLPYVCSHRTENDEVKNAHLYLPPSLGDPNTASDGHVLMDDLSPEMAKITYAIRARITKRNATGRLIEVASKSERIRIIPGREEEPPMNIDPEDSDYVLRKDKSVRKGLFKVGKIGRLVAETSQPKSLRLPHPRDRSKNPVTTVATINLRFDPFSPEHEPPQLGSIVSRLKAFTFYGAAPHRQLPELRRCDQWSTLHGLYPESVELSSRCLSTVSWTRHDSSRQSSTVSAPARRASSFSTSSTASIPEPSCQYQAGSIFYTANVLVPISLPSPQDSGRSKVFVPTFHSCIVSRVYALDLNLSFHSSNNTVGASHIVLKAPIQISAEGGNPPEPVAESDEAMIAEIERQFGLYEGRQDTDELGVQTPVYEEVVLNQTRHASLPSGAPPEYRAFAGGLRGASGARTHSVSIQA